MAAHPDDALLPHYLGFALYRQAAVMHGGPEQKRILDAAEAALARSTAIRPLPGASVTPHGPCRTTICGCHEQSAKAGDLLGQAGVLSVPERPTPGRAAHERAIASQMSTRGKSASRW